ncbi:hypothetical protein RJ639_007594 [Escallonia herrerae]|uniref:DUF2470 domain-containing protein n=1 Tax=Escallonia herrerae TaxID=1293975 RepID=A0AA88VXQ9_9ASTE|nr:hypothetical protein RJ639_007594 [Escallonia herrerae]
MKTLVAPSALRCSISPFSRVLNYHITTTNHALNVGQSPLNSPICHSNPSSLFSPTARRRSPLLAMASSTQSPAQNLTADTTPELNFQQLIQAHQEKAARLPPVEEVRTVLDHSLRGMLSTFSQKHEGYPSGSMVDFACDAYGSPILAVSSLAVHTKDLLANPKCSLLVAKDPEDRTDLIITVHGDAVPVSIISLPVPGKDREGIRNAYLTRHPDAFWVDFGDFQFMRIEPKVVRFVSGVATALLGSGEFTKEEFRAAKVDPLYQFSKPVASHMNRDHAEDTKLIVQHSISIPVDSAYMLDLDSLGFNVKAGYKGSTLKLRVPFPRRAVDRKKRRGGEMMGMSGFKVACNSNQDHICLHGSPVVQQNNFLPAERIPGVQSSPQLRVPQASTTESHPLRLVESAES